MKRLGWVRLFLLARSVGGAAKLADNFDRWRRDLEIGRTTQIEQRQCIEGLRRNADNLRKQVVDHADAAEMRRESVADADKMFAELRAALIERGVAPSSDIVNGRRQMVDYIKAVLSTKPKGGDGDVTAVR